MQGSWREASAPHILSIIRRTPLAVQNRLKPGDRGGPPTRSNMVQLLADWEKEERLAPLRVRVCVCARARELSNVIFVPTDKLNLRQKLRIPRRQHLS
jgi:hypothetical protein